jgi:hypothetical protein
MDRNRRSKSILTIPTRALATAIILQGRLRVNKGAGSGGKTRKHMAWNNKGLIVLITWNQSRVGWSGGTGT